MTEVRGGSISAIIKEKASISDVAEGFGISRPTLYKYMDYYDAQEIGRIPQRILAYFRMMSEEGATADDSIDYLRSLESHAADNVHGDDLRTEFDRSQRELEMLRRRLMDSEARCAELMHKDSTDRRRQSDDASEQGWSKGRIRTKSVGHDGRSMVMFSDAFPSPEWTTVMVSVDMDGEDFVIGRYAPEPGMNFVTVDNLLPKMEYRYRVEQGRGSETAVSETRTLRMR